MGFSYDINLTNDSDMVRFHIGDTDDNGNYLEDETIIALIASEGSVGGAVIACIKYIMSQLSSPNFKLDWLTVSNEQAREGFEKILDDKAQQFGISKSGMVASSSIGLPSRADSFQDSDNVYDGADA